MSDENKELTPSDEINEVKTVEQEAKARISRRDAEEMQLRKKLREYRKNKKELERLEKEIAKADESFKEAHKANRSNAMIVIGTTMVAMFGYREKDKECVSKKDFQSLIDAVIADVQKLRGEEEYRNYHFDYDDLVFALGLLKEEKMCSVPEDYQKLNTKIAEKVKELMQENADKRKKLAEQ